MTYCASIRLHKGFSLIEVMITLVILAGGLLALSKFQTDIVVSNSQAKQRTEATMRAQQKIDELRSFSTLAEYNDAVSGSDTVAGTSASYLRTWVITTHSTAPLYKEIAVTVSWQDSRGTTHSVNVSSDIASNDPKMSGNVIINTTSTSTSTSTSSTSTSTSSTSTSTAGGTTTSTAATTSTTATTTTIPSTISSTTTTTTTTAATTPCACKRTGSSSNYRATAPTAICTNSCCQAFTPKCTGNNCTFTAQCSGS